LKICASNGRSLGDGNYSAPRLVREVSGDFAVEVCISSVSEDKPQIGGLLIWKDKDNYFTFEKGYWAKREIQLGGIVNKKFKFIGRGMLPESENDDTYLRLERKKDEFITYGSIDGENWYTVGNITFLTEDPIQVGIIAKGEIDRTIYCGEYKEGTSTLFRSFRIWTKDNTNKGLQL
jgi:regulation of enolase protein 1 (concanavalin A-like superfamily)